jgi:hypothetical protein
MGPVPHAYIHTYIYTHTHREVKKKGISKQKLPGHEVKYEAILKM